MKNITYTLFLLCFGVSCCQTIHAQTLVNPIGEGKTISFTNTKLDTKTPTYDGPRGDLPPRTNQLDRKVFWLHGHGGGIGSWDRAASATQDPQVPPVSGYPARKIQSHKMDYSASHNAVSAAASQMKTSIEVITNPQSPTEKARNVVVAHSMGGLVSQYMDYLYDQPAYSGQRSFYGLVTVGTPSQGAVLAKNAYPFPGSKAQQFANDACVKLGAGPIKEQINNNFFLNLLISNQHQDKLVQQFCDLLTDDIVTLLLKGFNTTIAADLQPSSQVVSTLQGFTPNITRRVAMYGVLDNTDLIWKTYHYLKNAPNDVSFGNADEAALSVDQMKKNEAKYIGKYEYWKAKREYWQNLLNSCWIPQPLCIAWAINEQNAKENRDAWKKGVDWWAGANDGWRNLMGDLTLVNNPQGQCKCYTIDVSQGGIPVSPPVATMGLNGNCTSSSQNYPFFQVCAWESALTLQDVDSDGIVPASSAMALPGATSIVRMDGDSHFQLVNSPRTKSSMKNLWDGTYGDFFTTDPR